MSDTTVSTIMTNTVIDAAVKVITNLISYHPVKIHYSHHR